MPANLRCTFCSDAFNWSHADSAHRCDDCGSFGHGSGHPLCVKTRDALSASTVTRTCPSCKMVGKVNLSFTVFTGGDCIVCMDSKPTVIFDECRHANVCVDCVTRID